MWEAKLGMGPRERGFRETGGPGHKVPKEPVQLIRKSGLGAEGLSFRKLVLLSCEEMD